MDVASLTVKAEENKTHACSQWSSLQWFSKDDEVNGTSGSLNIREGRFSEWFKPSLFVKPDEIRTYVDQLNVDRNSALTTVPFVTIPHQKASQALVIARRSM